MAHKGFTRPLHDVRVLDLTRLLPGPFCTMLLADMGADVLKVEAPQGGDYARWYPPLVGEYGALFASVNRGKRSIAVDLKRPEGVELVKRLAAQADVLVESFRPGVAARLGLGHEALQGLNPKLVYCAITGYGQDGPFERRAGHDLNYLALAGVLEQTGPAGGPPVIPGAQIADLGGGALFASTAICAALFQAARTQKGAFLDISMTEGALAFHLPVQGHSAAGETQHRGANLLTGAVPCYRVYATSDGRHLAVGALEPKFWMTFMQAIGLPELANRGIVMGREADEVGATVQARLREKTLEEWVAVLAVVDACVEPILTPQEVVQHPQHQAREVFFAIEAGQGPLHQTATPVTPRGADRPTLPPPRLGEHTRAVLEELELTQDQIGSLFAGDIVAG